MKNCKFEKYNEIEYCMVCDRVDECYTTFNLDDLYTNGVTLDALFNKNLKEMKAPTV